MLLDITFSCFFPTFFMLSPDFHGICASTKEALAVYTTCVSDCFQALMSVPYFDSFAALVSRPKDFLALFLLFLVSGFLSVGYY